MIHQNMELHNTVELEPAAGGGVHLRRFPCIEGLSLAAPPY